MYKKTHLSVIFVCLFMLANTSCLQANSAEAQNPAARFIDNIAAEVLNILNNGGRAINEHKLVTVFEDAVEIEWMAKFALGRNWQNLDENQRHRYVQAYRQYLIDTYVHRFVEYNGQKFTINAAKQVSGDNYVVYTTLLQVDRSKADFKIDYRLNAKYSSQFGHFRIVDIVFEGVSMITSQRAEFNEVVNNKGIDALITTLMRGHGKVGSAK